MPRPKKAKASIKETKVKGRAFAAEVKGRAFGSPLARGLYRRASTAEMDPRAKPGAPSAVDPRAKPGALTRDVNTRLSTAETDPQTKPGAPAAAPAAVGYAALVGRPNVGKSTLLNRILGQKISIVSNKPQTTRISILGIHTTDKGQIIFIDNPGIHKPLHKLNKRMMNFVHSSLETADLICLLIDATQRFGHGDEFVLETLKNTKKPLFLLINKVDIVAKGNILPMIEQYRGLADFKEIIPLSALKGTNVDVLERLIFENLPVAEKLYGDDDITDQSQRFLLAEIIREKVLAHVEKELPWATATYIDSIERREPEGQAEQAPGNEPSAEDKKAAGEEAKTIDPDHIPGVGPTPKPRRPVTYIKASIFVEKDNHRKIVIGRHGHLIKQIGIEARLEIEEILETKVYLDLTVKVREDWRDSADVLDLIEGQKEM